MARVASNSRTNLPPDSPSAAPDEWALASLARSGVSANAAELTREVYFAVVDRYGIDPLDEASVWAQAKRHFDAAELITDKEVGYALALYLLGIEAELKHQVMSAGSEIHRAFDSAMRFLANNLNRK
jgi:hypothetical protein